MNDKKINNLMFTVRISKKLIILDGIRNISNLFTTSNNN